MSVPIGCRRLLSRETLRCPVVVLRSPSIEHDVFELKGKVRIDGAVTTQNAEGYRGFGGSFGFETPVVSYAPRPISQAVEVFGEIIMDALKSLVRAHSKAGAWQD